MYPRRGYRGPDRSRIEVEHAIPFIAEVVSIFSERSRVHSA
jgi:hypothetical protein